MPKTLIHNRRQLADLLLGMSAELNSILGKSGTSKKFGETLAQSPEEFLLIAEAQHTLQSAGDVIQNLDKTIRGQQ